MVNHCFPRRRFPRCHAYELSVLVLLWLLAPAVFAAEGPRMILPPASESGELAATGVPQALLPVGPPPILGVTTPWHAAAGFHSFGPNEVARDAVVFDDGRGPALYVGGDFTAADAVLASRIARWTYLGWAAVGGGVNDRIWCLAVFDDGGGPALYAAGDFTIAGGVAANRIAKWNGTAWAPLGGGLDGRVSDLAVYDDGSGPALYAAGAFLHAGGVAANHIAKWKGGVWTSLGAGLDAPAIGLFAWNGLGGARLYVGGSFTSAGGAPADRVASWNGSSFQALGAGMNGVVGSFAAFDDGSGLALYAGGGFTSAGGVPARRIAKWDGSAWSALDPGLDGSVFGLGVWDDGSGPALYVGGVFNSVYDEFPARRLAQWKGGVWSPVGGGSSVYGTPTHWTTAFAAFDDSAGGGGEKLFVIGNFDQIDYGISRNVVQWDGTGFSNASDATGHGANAWVATLASVDLGAGPALYMGGDFSGASGMLSEGIARWDGAAWQPLSAGLYGRVNAIVGWNDGSGPALFAGGEFHHASGPPVELVAKWDGSGWSPLGAGLGGGRVSALAVFDDGAGPALYAGGQFASAGGAPASNVAKWNGSSWSALGEGLNDWVMSLAVFDDGSGPALYAGGPFRTALGGTVSWLAKWDGAHWVSVPGAPNGWLAQMMVYHDGSAPVLVVAGDFSEVGGNPANGIAKWDGTTWTPLGLDFSATGIGLHDDGSGLTLFAAGRFPDTPPGQQVLAKWTGGWGDTGIDFDSTSATRLLSFDDGSGRALYAGGAFTRIGDVASTYVAKLRTTPYLVVPEWSAVAEGESVDVPILLYGTGGTLSALSFSLDYDASCLDPDANDDGLLDHVDFQVSSAFSRFVSFQPLDTDGEIDISIFDWSVPMAALNEPIVAWIRFAAVCPLGATQVEASLAFSTSPAPSFGDLGAHDVAGSWSNGGVRIFPGPRGDCNRSGAVSAPDLTAIVLEIFDGDSSTWIYAGNPSYPGSPVGCDANASTLITSGDVGCANVLIFGSVCTGPAFPLAAAAPALEVSSAFDSGKVWLRGRLHRNGSAVGSLAYSLDLDPQVFDLAQIDLDLDGVPEHLRFPHGAPGLAYVRFSQADEDGELDILLADLALQPLEEGILVEVGIPAAAAPAGGFDLAADPAPSFGAVTGGDLPGIAVIGVLLFRDGFESGDTAGWTQTLP